ncbi:winged helix-turn-helix domain-containing protein [Fusibacillus kribbianus]|uniref:Winged helix-turn-helix domain-containing protein n=1 Tax=Fusibacillus kribbianus TaxID=3044208 RepID=A0AAP4BD43_9FIRM|nr:response regulator transcription factor [Ruminococcus sp. YH-rum2234]MDI9243053.1 winged helix-turn-helix domain-containing protein [Ruminococcus sp. YH-rum2234]
MSSRILIVEDDSAIANLLEINLKVAGLKSGAEDYIVKHFEILELLVRVEKVLARNGRRETVLTAGEIKIDLDRRTVWKGKQEIFLKPMEYELLVLFAKNPKMTFTREQLLKEVWGETFMGETRTVDVHIGRLRKKLECPDLIRTVSRIGYRLEGMK